MPFFWLGVELEKRVPCSQTDNGEEWPGHCFFAKSTANPRKLEHGFRSIRARIVYTLP